MLVCPAGTLQQSQHNSLSQVLLLLNLLLLPRQHTWSVKVIHSCCLTLINRLVQQALDCSRDGALLRRGCGCYCCRCVCVRGWQLLCPAGARDPHLRAPGRHLGTQPAAIRCPAGPEPCSRFNQHLPHPSCNRTHQRDRLQVLACTTKIVPISESVTLKRAYTAQTGESTYDSLPQHWAFGTATIVVDAWIERARVDSSASGCCLRKLSSCCGAAFLPCCSFCSVRGACLFYQAVFLVLMR